MLPTPNAVRFGTDYMKFLGPKIWNIISESIYTISL